MFGGMAQITVRAAARVLGLQHGQVVTYEETPLLRGLVDGGKLVDLTAPEAEAEAAEPAEASGGEAASRAKHPAFRRRFPAGTEHGEGG